MLLAGKVILLTGGSSGIGRECGLAYAREGARVAVFALPGEELHKTVAELGEGHLALAGDVSKPGDVQGAIERLLAQYGRLDAIHNNAGVGGVVKALHETDEADWDRLFAVNIKGVYWTARFGYEAIKKAKGSILNTSSMAAIVGQSVHAAYSATKGAMNTLTRSMALDYAKDGVRVNAVCPAGVWTPLLERWCAKQSDPAAFARYLDEIHALGYCPRGDAIADPCVFLLSDQARFITGCILPVSGGAELGYRGREPG